MQNPFPGAGGDEPERQAAIVVARVFGAIIAFLYTPYVHGWAVDLCVDIVRERYNAAGVPWVAPTLWIATPLIIYSLIKQVGAVILLIFISQRK